METMSIKHRYEPTTSFHWLEFPGKPGAETRAILKAEHWRFIGANLQWRKAGLLTRLPELPGYEYEECGTVDFSADRAEHYEDRAERAARRADAAHGKADATSSLIPFGQPILVGHHSERRHRRDLDKINSNMRKAIEERERRQSVYRTAQRQQNDTRRRSKTQARYSGGWKRSGRIWRAPSASSPTIAQQKCGKPGNWQEE